MAMARRGFISFLNDDDSKVETYCEILEEKENYVKIKIGLNEIIVPYHRLLKLKEAKNGN
jgi:uncharacterized protein (UPF0248 family)